MGSPSFKRFGALLRLVHTIQVAFQSRQNDRKSSNCCVCAEQVTQQLSSPKTNHRTKLLADGGDEYPEGPCDFRCNLFRV